jgi:hypothetical protein
MKGIFTKDDYKLIMTTMMKQMRHLSTEERVKVGSVVNKMRPLANGEDVEVLSFEETKILMDKYASAANTKNSFESFDELMEDIAKHNRNIDGPVTFISTDFPLQIAVGWTCVESGRVWQIRISTLKEWAKANIEDFGTPDKLTNSTRAELLLRCQSSLDGKNALCVALSNIGKTNN